MWAFNKKIVDDSVPRRYVMLLVKRMFESFLDTGGIIFGVYLMPVFGEEDFRLPSRFHHIKYVEGTFGGNHLKRDIVCSGTLQASSKDAPPLLVRDLPGPRGSACDAAACDGGQTTRAQSSRPQTIEGCTCDSAMWLPLFLVHHGQLQRRCQAGRLPANGRHTLRGILVGADWFPQSSSGAVSSLYHVQGHPHQAQFPTGTRDPMSRGRATRAPFKLCSTKSGISTPS